jgi:hypothetical protein
MHRYTGPVYDGPCKGESRALLQPWFETYVSDDFSGGAVRVTYRWSQSLGKSCQEG